MSNPSGIKSKLYERIETKSDCPASRESEYQAEINRIEASIKTEKERLGEIESQKNESKKTGEELHKYIRLLEKD